MACCQVFARRNIFGNGGIEARASVAPLVHLAHLPREHLPFCSVRKGRFSTLCAQLKARLTKTIAFLKSVEAGKFAGAEDREIHLKFPQREFHFSGKDYLNNWVLPNVYFHITTGYDILRNKGVGLGKQDFLGGQK